MAYVVYHVKSTMENREGKRFKYAGHARNYARKLSADKGIDYLTNPEYAFTTVEDYNTNVVKMVTRRNLMSGKEYQEPSNTPNYCSPASESYWSM